MRISVIVPVYKVEKYIRRCIDSILAQTYEDFELILVDDGSPDDCGNICDEYAVNDNRIKVIHKDNGGLSSARNAGLDWVFEFSDSQFITFIDSDDYVDKNYLYLLLKALVQENADVSCCRFTEDDERSADVHNTNILVYGGERFCVDNYFYSHTAWGRLFPRKCFENLRFPFGKIHEDAFTVYKILLPADRVSFISDPPLYYFEKNNFDSITRSEWTPKRMDGLEALEQKIEYSKINGFHEYYRLQIKDYLNTLYWNYQKARKNNNRECKKIIRHKMKKAIKLAKQNKVLSLNKRNYHFYETAYPLIMKSIYMFVSGLKKVLKRGKNEKD